MDITVKIENVNDSFMLSRQMRVDSVFDFTRIAPIRNAIKQFLKDTNNLACGVDYVLNVREADNDYIVAPGKIQNIKIVPIEELLLNVMSKFGTTYDHVYQNRYNRTRHFAEPRHVFATMAKIFTRETLETIGWYFGKDHATVISSFRSVYKALAVSEDKITTIVKNIGIEYNNPMIVYNILKEKYFKWGRK